MITADTGPATSLTRENALEFWDSRYLERSTPWDRGTINPALLEWLAEGRLLPCRVLIPGCGRGYEAIELARRGFEVVALDMSPTAVRELNRALDEEGLKAEVVETDLFQWTGLDPFDAVYEQTCLCALVPEQWPAYERKLASWLDPGGALLALFMQTGKGGGPPFHCDLSAMAELFRAGRWRWPDEKPLRIPHPAGIHELGLILERDGDDSP